MVFEIDANSKPAPATCISCHFFEGDGKFHFCNRANMCFATWPGMSWPCPLARVNEAEPWHLSEFRSSSIPPTCRILVFGSSWGAGERDLDARVRTNKLETMMRIVGSLELQGASHRHHADKYLHHLSAACVASPAASCYVLWGFIGDGSVWPMPACRPRL